MRKADSSHDVLDNNEYLPRCLFELFTRQLNLSFFIVGEYDALQQAAKRSVKGNLS